MKATFTKAVVYRVEAVCQTQLRTGGTGGDTELVLWNQQGKAIIQGSSLAGAFRNWLENSDGAKSAAHLFGDQEHGGCLMVSEGVFSEDAVQVTRPRLRIDSRLGAAAPKGKFDVAHMAARSQFTFQLTWLGSEETSAETEIVERMLSALHRGEIRLGAQKSNGFGRVELTVRKCVYDLFKADDRLAWLEDRCEDGQLISLPEIRMADQVTFTLLGQADSILVKGAAADHGKEGSIIRNMQESGKPVIPGSSIRGAVRARAALIAGYKGLPEEMVDTLFGRMSAQGDNGISGKIRFEDAVLSPDRVRKIARIRINRFTASVIRGGLFFEEPVCAAVQLRITIPAEYREGCGLLVYALRDLALGLYNLGSGDAIGRGRITVREIRIEVPGKREAALAFDVDRQCIVSDPNGLVKDWLDRLEVHK